MKHMKGVLEGNLQQIDYHGLHLISMLILY